MKTYRRTKKKQILPLCLFIFTISVFYFNLAFGVGEFQRKSLLSEPASVDSKSLSDVAKSNITKQKNAKKKVVSNPKPKPKPKPKPERKSITLNSLPKSYAGWRLLLVDYVDQRPAQCELRSDVKTMFDGVGNTAIELRINTKRVRLLTDSSIDSMFYGVGLTMASGEVLAFDYVEEDTNVVFDITPDRVLNKLVHDDSILIDLAFWPSSKTNRKYSSKIDAATLKDAFRDLSKCEKLIENKA